MLGSASAEAISSTFTGRASFGTEQLEVNIKALVDALNRARPQSAKGIYLRKVAVSSTMGVGVRVDTASFSASAN